MKSKILIIANIALAGGAMITQSALAGGIGLYEIASPDVGLASAGYSARAQDASTLFKNPAGMSLLDDGPQLQAGAQVIFGQIKFSPNSSTSPALGTADGGNALGPMPAASFFYTQKLNDRLAVGFGTFSYVGLAQKYDDNWVGRYYVQKDALIGVSFMPAASYKINDWLSVGGGLNTMLGYMDYQGAIRNPGPGDGQMKYNDEAWGVGGIGGIIITPREGTRLGVTYVSPVKLDFNDTPSFSGLHPLISTLPIFHQNLAIGVTVPQSVMFGVWQKLNDKWAVMADVGWQNWSQFGQADIGFNGNSLTTQLHYDDTWHGAIGAEYAASEKWLFTGGFAYDTSAVSDANRTVTLPMGEQYRFGLGALWKYSKSLDFGAAYEFVWMGDMSVNQGTPASYRGEVSGSYNNAWLSALTVNLTWRF